MKIGWNVTNKNCLFIYKYLEFDSLLYYINLIIINFYFYNSKYIFSLQIESNDSFTDNEYLCKKSESSHSSKCIEISSTPKAKKLKLEDKCPPIGWSDNLNNITHTRNTRFAHHLYGYIFTSRCYNVLVEGFGFLSDREIAVDEDMIGFNGRISFRQYLPSKSVKHGIKFYAILLQDIVLNLKYILVEILLLIKYYHIIILLLWILFLQIIYIITINFTPPIFILHLNLQQIWIKRKQI